MSLICCVHDVTPRHFARLRAIDALLKHVGLQGKYSMLVVPDFWNQWDLKDHPQFSQWIRARMREGVEILLHGYNHQDETQYNSSRKIERWKATHMTAKESEFLGLSYSEAVQKLENGQQKLEQEFGIRATGFVAPAWLYSKGAKQALSDQGFFIAENQFHVWNPVTKEILNRTPVISYASRTKSKIATSLLWSRLALHLLKRTKLVRFAIHPHDLDSFLLQTEILRALKKLTLRRKPIFYRDLAPK